MSEQNVKEVAQAFRGWTIVGSQEISSSDAWDNGPWGRIILQSPEGKKGYIEPSCDPEGNAPGFCFFSTEETA